jgi:hypothetical protein
MIRRWGVIMPGTSLDEGLKVYRLRMKHFSLSCQSLKRSSSLHRPSRG